MTVVSDDAIAVVEVVVDHAPDRATLAWLAIGSLEVVPAHRGHRGHRGLGWSIHTCSLWDGARTATVADHVADMFGDALKAERPDELEP